MHLYMGWDVYRGQAWPLGVLLYHRPPLPLETGNLQQDSRLPRHLTHSQSVTLGAVSGTQRQHEGTSKHISKERVGKGLTGATLL